MTALMDPDSKPPLAGKFGARVGCASKKGRSRLAKGGLIALLPLNPAALRAGDTMWSMSSLEAFRPLITALLTTFGLIVLSRLLPAFDRITEHHSSAFGVAYDLCLAGSLAFTLTFFFTGLGFV